MAIRTRVQTGAACRAPHKFDGGGPSLIPAASPVINPALALEASIAVRGRRSQGIAGCLRPGWPSGRWFCWVPLRPLAESPRVTGQPGECRCPAGIRLKPIRVGDAVVRAAASRRGTARRITGCDVATSVTPAGSDPAPERPRAWCRRRSPLHRRAPRTNQTTRHLRPCMCPNNRG